MIRSMFTAISSLGLHQKYLDVVSNNLANANTTGYKSSRVLFQDQFSQMMNPGSAPTATQGGTNPTQIGLGVRLGYVSGNFTQGTLQNTGRNLDLSVQGDGFFIYGQNAGRRYSREGSMSLDADGYLVNMATGLRTQGWLTGANGIDTNAPVDDIQIDSNRAIAKVSENVLMSGNLSANADGGDTVDVTMGVYELFGRFATGCSPFHPRWRGRRSDQRLELAGDGHLGRPPRQWDRRWHDHLRCKWPDRCGHPPNGSERSPNPGLGRRD